MLIFSPYKILWVCYIKFRTSFPLLLFIVYIIILVLEIHMKKENKKERKERNLILTFMLWSDNWIQSYCHTLQQNKSKTIFAQKPRQEKLSLRRILLDVRAVSAKITYQTSAHSTATLKALTEIHLSYWPHN